MNAGGVQKLPYTVKEVSILERSALVLAVSSGILPYSPVT